MVKSYLFFAQHSIGSFLSLGDIDQLNFRQFLNILAPFRRDKSTKNLDTKEKKLMFLFNVCFNQFLTLEIRILKFRCTIEITIQKLIEMN